MARNKGTLDYEAVRLLIEEGLSNKEIAAKLGARDGAIRVARTRLKERGKLSPAALSHEEQRLKRDSLSQKSDPSGAEKTGFVGSILEADLPAVDTKVQDQGEASPPGTVISPAPPISISPAPPVAIDSSPKSPLSIMPASHLAIDSSPKSPLSIMKPPHRPQTLEPWEKRTVTLYTRQREVLDALPRAGLGTSEILRAILDAVLDSGIDLGTVKTEAELREKVRAMLKTTK